MMPICTPITFELGAARAAAAGNADSASLPKSLLFKTMTRNYTGPVRYGDEKLWNWKRNCSLNRRLRYYNSQLRDSG